MRHACFAQAVRRYKSGDTVLGADCPGCGAPYAATVTVARVAAAAAVLPLQERPVEAEAPLFDAPRPQTLFALNTSREERGGRFDIWGFL